MFYAYRIVSWLYLVVPVLALALAVLQAWLTRRLRPVRVFLRACTTGTFLGFALVLVFSAFNHASMPPGQVAMACYDGISAVCMIIALSWLLGETTTRLMGIDPGTGEGGYFRGAHIAAVLLQALLLLAIGLPFLGALAALYRVKAPSQGDPQTLLGTAYQPVHFPATDGIDIAAWWIPAARGARTDDRGCVRWGADTVILCHGFGADKASQLFLARDLPPNGYNVLAIDLRAHGRSGGQFTGLGAVESRDVLGAVRWLRGSHPTQCRRLLGLGESLGAVALITAAADPSPEGRAIDAIAAYNPYDSLKAVCDDVLRVHAIAPGRWAAAHLALPLASAQVGADLATFSPALAAQELWPRPLLVIGNPLTNRAGDERSYELFRDTMQPRFGYFRDDLDVPDLLRDENAALTVRIFFDTERPVL